MKVLLVARIILKHKAREIKNRPLVDFCSISCLPMYEANGDDDLCE